MLSLIPSLRRHDDRLPNGGARHRRRQSHLPTGRPTIAALAIVASWLVAASAADAAPPFAADPVESIVTQLGAAGNSTGDGNDYLELNVKPAERSGVAPIPLIQNLDTSILEMASASQYSGVA